MTAEVITSATGDDQATGHNPDTLPTNADPSGLCPRCDHRSNFDVVGELPLKERAVRSGKATTERVTALRCQGCREGTAVVEVYSSGSGPYSSGKWTGVTWWPKAGHLDDTTDVPDNLADAFNEGARCVGVDAPNAAVAMFRNALAQIVHDKGSDEAKRKDTLNKGLFRIRSA